MWYRVNYSQTQCGNQDYAAIQMLLNYLICAGFPQNLPGSGLNLDWPNIVTILKPSNHALQC